MMRVKGFILVVWGFLVVFLSGLCPNLVQAEGTEMTLVYTGNTWGAIEPCKS